MRLGWGRGGDGAGWYVQDYPVQPHRGRNPNLAQSPPACVMTNPAAQPELVSSLWRDAWVRLRRNRLALDRIAFRPRICRDVSNIDVSGALLGRKMRIPVLLAPIGSLESFHPGGGATSAQAAEAFDIVHMLSSRCAPGPTPSNTARAWMTRRSTCFAAPAVFWCRRYARSFQCGSWAKN